MKNLLLLLAMFTFATVTVNAQETNMATETATLVSNADQAADHDASVEKRVCAKSGKVSFVKKSVCSTSGKVSYSDVEYCTKSNAFVNVSPSAGSTPSCTKGKKACTKKAAAGTGAAMKVSSVEGGNTTVAPAKAAKSGKACCAGKKAASCSKSAKAAKTSEAAAPVKAVKVSND